MRRRVFRKKVIERQRKAQFAERMAAAKAAKKKKGG